LGVAADAARKVLSGRFWGGKMMMKRISHISINKFKCRAPSHKEICVNFATIRPMWHKYKLPAKAAIAFFNDKKYCKCVPVEQTKYLWKICGACPLIFLPVQRGFFIFNG